MKELLEGFDGEIKAEFKAPASTTATTVEGGSFGFTSNGKDSYLAYMEGYNKARNKYRDAILKELARLRGIAPVGELPTHDERIDELLCILEDVEGDE